MKESWTPVSQKKTLDAYSHCLAQFCHACLKSIHNNPTKFKLSLQSSSIKLGNALLKELAQPSPSIDVLHSFLFTVVTVDKKHLQANKWNNPLEAFAAIYCMRPFSCFRSPVDVTPLLAKLKYAVKCIIFQQTLHEESEQILAMEIVMERKKKRAGIIQNGQRAEARATQTVLPKDDKETETLDFDTIAEGLCDKHMNLRKLCCYSMLAELDTYTSAAAYGCPGHANISWNEDLTAITYRDQTLNLHKFRKGLLKAFDNLERNIEMLHMGHHIEVVIPEDFVDDMSNRTFGYSYTKRITTVASNALFEAIMDDRTTKMAIEDSVTGKTELNTQTAHHWMSICADVNSLLVFLLHTTSGQTARGTEMEDLLIQNKERPRNFIMVHNHLMNILTYNKTSNLANEDSFMPYQLCKRLEKSMHQYLVVIRPMETILGHKLFGIGAFHLYQHFLMVQLGKKMNSTSFSGLLSRYSETYFHVPLKLLAMRHMWIAMKREYIPALYWNHQRGDDVGDMMAGHSTSTASRIYAIDKNGSQRANTTMLILAAQFSRKWHDFIGLGNNPPGMALILQQQSSCTGGQHVSHTYSTSKPFEDVIRQPPSVSVNCSKCASPFLSSEPSVPMSFSCATPNEVTDIEARIGKRVQMEVSRLKEDIAESIRESMSQVMAGAMAAAFLQHQHQQILQSCTPEYRKDQAQRQPDHLQQPNIRPQPQQLSQPSDTQYLLTPQTGVSQPISPHSSPVSLPSTSATYIENEDVMQEALSLRYTQRSDIMLAWKSNGQKELVCYTSKEQGNVVGIIPTGGGKSAVFEVLPHYLGHEEGYMTVVVCPYVALVDQIVQQNKEYTKCCEWRGGQSSMDCSLAGLVVVSADRSKREDFKK